MSSDGGLWPHEDPTYFNHVIWWEVPQGVVISESYISAGGDYRLYLRKRKTIFPNREAAVEHLQAHVLKYPYVTREYSSLILEGQYT